MGTAFLKMSGIRGFVMHRPLDAVSGPEPLWRPFSLDHNSQLRVPIFRYVLSGDDPDFHASVALKMAFQLAEREKQLPCKPTDITQRVFMRKTIVAENFLYQGIVIITQ